MVYTTPTTATAGNVATAASWNTSVRDNIEFLHDPPAARVYNSVNLSIPHNTATALTFNSERYDNDNIHDTGSNTSRLTCRTAGKYHCFASVDFASHSGGERYLLLRLNGTTPIVSQTSPAMITSGLPTDLHVSTDYPLIVGDYIEVVVWQATGGALNVVKNNNFSPEAGITWATG